MASATISFQYPKSSVEKLKEHAEKKYMGLSGFIQMVLKKHVKACKK